MSLNEKYNDGKFLLAWSICSVVTPTIPLLIFFSARIANRESDGEQVENQQAQQAENYREYQAGQMGGDDGCSWYQWGCLNYFNYKNEQEAENDSPWWWMWTEDEKREEGKVAPTMYFVYAWHLMILWAITVYGRRSVVNGGSLYGVAATCLMFANYSFISMLFLGGLTGAVFDDARSLDETGWYGQFGVLMYMTNITSVIFGIYWFLAYRRYAMEKEITKVEVTPEDYVAPPESA